MFGVAAVDGGAVVHVECSRPFEVVEVAQVGPSMSVRVSVQTMSVKHFACFHVVNFDIQEQNVSRHVLAALVLVVVVVHVNVLDEARCHHLA